MRKPENTHKARPIDGSREILECGHSTEPDIALIEKLPGLKEIRFRIHQHANNEAVMLLTGPTGTGKKYLAKYIHAISCRWTGPFIGVNCAAVTETLFEQEYFGRRRGSSTGASYDMPGFFGSADGGVLFLDEIGDIPLSQYAKLLEAIESGYHRRVGESDERFSDVKVICATNRDLDQMLESGTMREDFYYRINDVHIDIPPLKSRREDIPFYTEHFIRKHSLERGPDSVSIEPDALNLLLINDWPGNVRSLDRVLRKAVFECDNTISKELTEKLLLETSRSSRDHFDLRAERCRWEIQQLRWALYKANGKDAVAAQLLGLKTKRQFTQLKQRLGLKNRDLLR